MLKVVFVIPAKINGLWTTREEIRTRSILRPEAPYLLPQIASLLNFHLKDKIELHVIDSQLDDLDFDQVKKELSFIQPDLIIVPVTIYDIHTERKWIEDFNNPTMALILPMTLNHGEALSLYNLNVDYVVADNIEQSVLDGVYEFIETRQIKSAKGFYIKGENGYYFTGRHELAHLEEYPVPDFKLFRVGEYLDLIEKRLKIRRGYMLSAKGCIFQCAFCVSARNENTRLIGKTAKQIVNELDYLNREFGMNAVTLHDPEFSFKKKRAKEILELLVETGVGERVHLDINEKPELLDENHLKLMAQAGVKWINMGVESADEKVLKRLNKKVDLAHTQKIIEIGKQLGIKMNVFMTPGLLGETKDTLRLNADFISRAQPSGFSAATFFLTPNSPWYLELKTQGKILEEDWTEYRKLEKLCFEHDSYSNIEEVLKAKRSMIRKTFFKLMFKQKSLPLIQRVKNYLNTYKYDVAGY